MTYAKFTAVQFAIAVVAACCAASAGAESVPLQGASVDVLFAPQTDIQGRVGAFIDACRQRVWLAGYTFTSPTVSRALQHARRRGIDVRVVLDQSQSGERYSGATYLRNANVPVWINSKHAIMHHKFVVCDADGVAFGSANFTKAAMGGGNPAWSNAENFNLFSGAPQLAQVYADEFRRLVMESTQLGGGQP